MSRDRYVRDVTTDGTNPINERAIDVLIIGAGVIGCAIALELSRRGHRTLNVERGPAAGCGSTSNSSAVIRTSYSTPTGVNFSWEGVQYWKNWTDYLGVPDELGVVEYHECGQLLMMRHDGDHTSVVKRLWEELDIPHKSLSLADLTDRAPWMDTNVYGPPTKPDDDAFWKDSTGTLTGAVYSPEAGYISDPQLAAHNIFVAAEAAGARFAFGANVEQINVAGPHSDHINKLAGVFDSMSIKTAPMRQEVHHVPAPPSVDLMAHGFIMADDDIGYYVRPELRNNLLIGSLEPECDDLEWITDPDAIDTEITPDLWNTQVLRVNRRIPELGVPHQRRGAVGVYDVSDDWMPIYDRTDLDGFYVAIGTSGNQFKNAGVAGQLMADLIEAIEAGHDHDAQPLQFVGRYTGRTIDTTAFSRNRTVTAGSSMSVQG